MAGDGTVCDTDDDGIDLFVSWAGSTPTASEIQTQVVRQKMDLDLNARNLNQLYQTVLSVSILHNKECVGSLTFHKLNHI